MNRAKTMLALVGAVLMTAGAFADEPTITLRRCQQRYPWNGLVDIDYSVDLAGGNPEDYYVKFTVTTNGAATGVVATEFLDAGTLAIASNGAYRVTWDTEYEKAFIFSKDVTVRADLVFDPGCKGERSPYILYLEIDLTEGASAEHYPVTSAFIGTRAGCLKYNTDEYKTNKLVLRRIQAGTFTMGSPTTETGRESALSWMSKETQHEVTLTQDYYIGVFPVTQTQWLKVKGSNPSYFKGNADAATCPVEQVSYQNIRGATKGIAVPITDEVDAGSFLQLLRDKTGLTGLDLPTEAQWEYAARAGTTGSTYFGNNVTGDATLLKAHIWYSGNAGGTTHGVGQFPSNPWGLYDTLGGIWEWCRDRVTKAPNHDLGTAPSSDPLSQVAGGNGTYRGGSWGNDAYNSRSACRATDSSVSKADRYYGFRLFNTLP